MEEVTNIDVEYFDLEKSKNDSKNRFVKLDME